jgi:hypothetical protein
MGTGAVEGAPEEQHSGFMRSYFEKRGIAPRDVPMALIYFKLMNVCLWSTMFTGVYLFQPLRRMAKMRTPMAIRAALQTRYPDAFLRLENSIMHSSERLAEWRFFRPLPKVLGLDSKQTVLSVAETFLLYKVTMPFHVPLQFWAILYAMSSSKKRSTYAQMSSDVSSFADTSMHTASVNIASDGHR